jgi:uncharacterized phage protein (TIGR01671 family)
MRQIKFRMWDIEFEIMRYIVTDIHWALHGITQCSYVNSNTMDTIKVFNDSDCVWGKKRFILEQFTGLLDKNGIEIYEGDIIKEKETDYTTNVGGVLFSSGSFRFNYRKKLHKQLAPMGQSQLYNVEVVGNIHEQPESNEK